MLAKKPSVDGGTFLLEPNPGRIIDRVNVPTPLLVMSSARQACVGKLWPQYYSLFRISGETSTLSPREFPASSTKGWS